LQRFDSEDYKRYRLRPKTARPQTSFSAEIALPRAAAVTRMRTSGHSRATCSICVAAVPCFSSRTPTNNAAISRAPPISS